MTVAFSPDGRYVLTASMDQTAGIWDASTGRRVADFRGHTGWVRSGAYSPDGKFIATASFDGTARVWQTATRRSVAELRGHTAPVISDADKTG